MGGCGNVPFSLRKYYFYKEQLEIDTLLNKSELVF